MKILSAAIAISVGIFVLLGYFVGSPALLAARSLLVSWAILVGGFAVLVGAINLASVHLLKIRRHEKGSTYSFLLLVAMAGTILPGLVLGTEHPWMQTIVQAVIFPVEASLMAILSVTLVYAAVRLPQRRAGLMTVIFLASAIFMLVAGLSLPFLGQIPILSDWFGPWMAFGPVAGGARGILLGVALGTLTTGLRLLFATDRPYGGN